MSTYLNLINLVRATNAAPASTHAITIAQTIFLHFFIGCLILKYDLKCIFFLHPSYLKPNEDQNSKRCQVLQIRHEKPFPDWYDLYIYTVIFKIPIFFQNSSKFFQSDTMNFFYVYAIFQTFNSCFVCCQLSS